MDKYIAIARALLKYSPKRRKYRNFGSYEIVEPATVSDIRNVPNHIQKPPYYLNGIVEPGPAEPEIKNAEQIDAMRRSCQLASRILKSVGNIVDIGVTTDDIDVFIHEKCIENGAYPSTLWYKGFPKSVCTSVNNVAVHGIPDSRKLADGDIVNVDLTVYYNGYHGDCSQTFLIGNVDDQGKDLVSFTEMCLTKGISVCRPGTPFKEIGFAIEEFAADHGFTVLPAFTGHGIGTYFHGAPDIYHRYNYYPGKMRPGMTFTIEPVISTGGEMVEMLEDEWTVVTADNARTSQAEHTILITDEGCEILTK